MTRTLTILAALSVLAAPAAAADGSNAVGLDWGAVLQTLVAVVLLVLLARGTAGEEQDERRRARGRRSFASLSSGSW